MINRRNFIKQASAACAVGCVPGLVSSSAVAAPGSTPSNSKIWSCFLHLSFNFAAGIYNQRWAHPRMGIGPRTEFETEQAVWDDAIKKMAEQNINMVVINLDDSIVWRSHPEIALKNSWTPEKLREELAKMRKLGIEPIPLLNFSTAHDLWMGEYAKMVSTKPYYQFCKDLIAEAIEIFDKPRFIHFGMDEETYGHQSDFDYVVVRRNDQWWNDLYFYFDEATNREVRPWVWSDYVWHHPDLFFKKMPKYAIQSNWYYGEEFDLEKLNERTRRFVQAYIDLNAAGYDQIPTASNDAIMYGPNKNNKSIGNTVEFSTKHIDDKHLLGFLQSMWMPTTEKYRPNIMETIELTGAARRKFESKE